MGAVKLDDYVVSAKKNDGVVELDPFEVSGEKPKAFSTSSIDIVRTADDVLPFTVFSGKEIEEAGSASLSEFFRQRFSQLVTGVIHEENLIAGAANPDNPLRRLTPSKIGLVNGGGAESVLGSAEVVFLLNGRRIQNQTYGIDDVRGSAYFNGIPVASIERIEITTSSVSAIYGAGATGGVINIVTKNAYKGGFIRGTYETPSDTYAPTCTLDLSYATPLIRGWMCRVNYSYNRHIPLKLGDRADVTINRHRSNILAREPERLTLEGVPLGSTTNILVFTPDFSIDFVTSVPEGYSGASDAAPLLARKGMFNLALADGAASGQSGYGANSWLGARSENESFGLSFEGPLWKNWVALVEYSRRQAKFVGTPSPYLRSFNAFVSASSPINPFNQDVLVNFYDPRLDRPEFVRKHRNLTEEVVVSIRGTHGQWRSLVDYTSTRTKDSAFGVGFEPYSQAGSFWGNAYAAGTYNPFVDMRSVAPALPGFYTDYASDALGQGGKNRSHQITAKLSGPLWELPAGTTEATAGIEYNHWESMDQYWFNIRSRTTTGEVLFPTTIQAPTVPSESNSKSAYMEANMPLWDSRAKGIGLRRLEVFGSIRIERQELAEGNGLVDLDEF